MKLAIIGSRSIANIDIAQYVSAEIKEIIDACDAVLVFWDGSSKGTAHSIRYAKKIGKPIEVVVVPHIGTTV